MRGSQRQGGGRRVKSEGRRRIRGKSARSGDFSACTGDEREREREREREIEKERERECVCSTTMKIQ